MDRFRHSAETIWGLSASDGRGRSARPVREEPDQPDDDEIERHDVVEQAGHDEDDHAGDQRDQRRERQAVDIHGRLILGIFRATASWTYNGAGRPASGRVAIIFRRRQDRERRQFAFRRLAEQQPLLDGRRLEEGKAPQDALC